MSSELTQIYSVYVSALTNTENRRQASNQIFFSICLALTTAYSTIDGFSENLASGLISFTSVVWFISIGYYRSLSRAKFHVIVEIEDFLQYQPFKREWENVSSHQRYIGLTRLELFSPLAMVILSILIFLGGI